MVGLSISNSIDITGRVYSVAKPSAAFKQRVLDDSGAFEAQQCLDDLISQGLFDSANFVLTPNGYKSGKLYALKPDSGDLDIVWQRNGNATRVNKDGLIESVNNDVPRLDYTNSDCPSLLIEPQSTNLVEDSENIIIDGGVTRNIQVVNSYFGLGFNKSFKIDKSIAIENQGITSILRFQNNFQDGVVYTFSFYLTSSDNTPPDFGASVGKELESAPYGYSYKVEQVLGTNIYKCSFTTNRLSTAGTIGIQQRTIYEGNKSFNVIGFQIEEGAKATSYIPTNGSTVTRPADAPLPITPPIGTTEIVEVFEDGTTNTITTIPLTYTIPFGRFKYILFN